MVEGGGFEPPKQEATDLQSAPFGHSGTPPYPILICFASQRLKYDITKHRACQYFFEKFFNYELLHQKTEKIHKISIKYIAKTCCYTAQK